MRTYAESLKAYRNNYGVVETARKEFNARLQHRNVYYDDLIRGNILQTLRATALPKDAFRTYVITGQAGWAEQSAAPLQRPHDC
ncbi:MAG: hypothetical protein H7Z72_07185 [Bacteroidetes bacterium]|nr:hypothetical protein [Fibrella sp.]